ncbi:3'-5' exonuclease [Rhizobium sp. S96]|uniref:3'-5' exonuclease n=1 Tax=Rhizobium sp. S96 TaxID=3055140 RepID=UPI0025AA6739|nr:3'-5' exonuclease [Rhizobium sp. S96]MDM9619112.1 3'-5' exonuclease [Rhizobium sp. S96]
MIDIETLGTAPGSVIASIGAVEFDASNGEFGRQLYVIVDIESAQRAGLTMDAATVKWWLQQSDAARANTFATGQHINMALIDLQCFIENAEPTRIWAHSPSFDLVQLDAAYRKTDLRIPWTFRQHRDTRTLFDLTGVKIQPNGTHHDALDDAKAQALAVVEAYRLLPPPVSREGGQ